MQELSLFTGAGGGLLASHLLGWTPIGYVEYDDYCQRIIAQRIADGHLPNAPIFGDVRTFISDGYAAAYTGMVDVVSGGFPCQPFSRAGRQLGADDARNMWPATVECVRIIRPRFAFLENVPSLLTSGYFGTILGDLAAAGYNAKWTILSACALGAPHTRERLFIVANANSSRSIGRSKRTTGRAIPVRAKAQERSQHHAQGGRLSKVQVWSTKETDILRMADGVGSGMDRIRAIGNGQVPAVAAAAWHLLTEDLP